MSARVAVRHYLDANRPWVISADQYDPDVHELWDDDVPASDLPSDIPGRDHLIAAGLVTMSAVLDMHDFDEIAGIGQATERKILAYLGRGATDEGSAE